MTQTLARTIPVPLPPTNLKRLDGDRFSGAIFTESGYFADGRYHPAPATAGMLTLDYHTAQLLPDSYRSRPIEALFGCDELGCSTSVFAGRLVPLDGRWASIYNRCKPDRQRWVPIIQEVGRNGQTLTASERPCFVGLPVNELESGVGHPLTVEQIRAFWQTELSADENTGDGPLPYVYPDWRRTIFVRCHYDRASGFGCRIWPGRRCEMVDLRVPLGQELVKGSNHHFALSLPGEEIDIEAPLFHNLVEKMLRDARGEPYHAIRFSEQSEEAQSVEVVGCRASWHQWAQESFSFMLTGAMMEGEPLAKFARVRWFPFTSTRLEVFDAARGWRSIAMPDSMKKNRLRVLKKYWCRVPRIANPLTLAPAQKVRFLWANKFCCESEPVNGHVAAFAQSHFEERMSTRLSR